MAFEELKQKQSVVWGTGPYQNITETITDIHERVIEGVADDCLNGKNGDIGNQQEFNRWGDPARTEGDLSSLVLHVV